MNRFYRLICVVLVLAGVPCAYAAEVTGLYESEVIVTAQDQAQRTEAIRAAFIEVLVKVTGRRDIATSGGVSEIINNPAPYLQQYLYRTAPATPVANVPSLPRAAPALPSAVPSPPNRTLWVRFDEVAINKMLRQRNLPVWGRARPAVLLWLALDEPSGRGVVGMNDRPEWRQLIDSVAKSRGVPVALPLLDGEDRSNLSAVNVWGDATDDVLRISARYPTEAVLIGRISTPSPGVAEGAWSLLEQRDRNSWANQFEARDKALSEGLHLAFDALADRYGQAVAAGPAGGLLVQVRDIQSIDDYARVTKYLSALAAVERVSVVQAEGPNMIFRVEARGGAQRLVQDIRLGSTLVPVTDAADKTTNPEVEHAYRLMR